MPLDKMRVLEPLIPNELETKTMKIFKGDASSLGPAEQFFLEMIKIPRMQVFYIYLCIIKACVCGY